MRRIPVSLPGLLPDNRLLSGGVSPLPPPRAGEGEPERSKCFAAGLLNYASLFNCAPNEIGSAALYTLSQSDCGLLHPTEDALPAVHSLPPLSPWRDRRRLVLHSPGDHREAAGKGALASRPSLLFARPCPYKRSWLIAYENHLRSPYRPASVPVTVDIARLFWPPHTMVSGIVERLFWSHFTDC
jgi:hypothetical protein